MYRHMVLSRELDRRMLALQRQGRIGTYAMLEGQEAVQIGSALALDPDDFVFPSYREHGVQVTRGLPIEVLLAYWKGLPNARWDMEKYRTGIVSVPIASQLPHAVGYSYVTKLRGENTVTAVYFGDGATSEVDFHSGMNFAGVWKTPTVFICANNLYAISVPYEKQTASETIAQKAGAYGFEGSGWTGWTPLPCSWRRGKPSTDVHAMGWSDPYRGDDLSLRPPRHRRRSHPLPIREEEDSWRQRDPIERLRRFSRTGTSGTTRWRKKVTMETSDLVAAAITEIEAQPLPERDDAIRHGFHRIPAHVVEQLHDMQRSHGEPPTHFDPERDLVHRPGRHPRRAGPVDDHGRGDQRRPPPIDGTGSGCHRARRGCRPDRWGLQGDRRPPAEFRGETGSSTHRSTSPASSGPPWEWLWPGQARGRDPVRRLRVSGLRPDRQSSGQIPVPHAWQFRGPGRGAFPQRSRHRRPRAPL